ncbi:MAG: SUMF1/EgtB/PvdO family nonheme iron enzyme [Candidatus Eremiobacterota bacterium]
MKFSRNFLIGFILLLCVSVYGIINLTGCGALVALVSSIFGSQGGFVFIPFLSEDKLISEQSGTSTGMIVLYSNNPPSGYHGAEGATVTIGGVKGTTDGKGYFNLSGLPVGLNTLTVEYGSFVPIEQPVVVADPNGSSVSFSGFKVIPERLLCPVGIGGTYQFSVYAADSNGNPVIPSATWSVEGDIGTVSSTGIFTATKSGIGKVVAVNGSNRSEVSITVTDGSGTVKGAVTYNGNGLSGVKVKAENFTNYAITDGSGNYVLPGIPSNPVTVIATGTDGKSGTGYGSVPAGGEVEVNIVLTGNPVTPTPVLTPGDIPRGDIGGKIVEYDGTTPIGGAFVVFYSYSYPSGSSLEGSSVPLKTATADSGGNFAFTGVPQGACRVEFWRSESEYNGSPGSPFGAVNDEVTAGGKSISVRPLVEPTATATATATVTPTAVATATPVVEPPMVAIPGGTFDMGSTVSSSYEEPVHSVTVSPFNMFKYEVRNSDYVLFLNSEGNHTEGGVEWINIVADQYQGITGGPGYGTFSVISGYESRPVVYVSWYGAVAYCNWLSTQRGVTPCYGEINNRGDDPSVWRTLNGYRLPTEAEWEYACRSGSTAEYYWGDPYPPDPPNIGNYAWYYNNAGDGYGGFGNENLHVVGGKLPNSFGLYDMSGNVSELCSDWDYYYGAGPYTNPTGPTSGDIRVMRGGDIEGGSYWCRSALRQGMSPDGRNYMVGFRPVRN